ncbi:MAG: ribosomal protein L13e [Candidatus Odinarchaeia archaeon]
MTEVIRPKVKYPKNKLAMREGRGFSLGELKEANLNVHMLKLRKIPVDRRRRTVHKENIELLKTLFAKPKKKKEIKKQVKPKEPVKPKKPQKKKTVKTEEIDKQAIKDLAEIKGLTIVSAKKLIKVGVMSKKDLAEMSEDLDILSEETGIPIEKLEKWVKQIKK